MAKKTLYANEIATAGIWIEENKDNILLKNFIEGMKKRNANIIHSYRWSICYDFLKENFPDKISLTTGFAYWLED